MKLAPMLASIGTEVPSGKGWTFEPKYDGVRVLAVADRKTAALLSRNGRNKADQFPEITRAVRAFATRVGHEIVLDGEIVARLRRGIGRFQDLQGRINLQNREQVARESSAAPTTLEVFDLLVDGKDALINEPWTVRRERLEELFTEAPRDPGLHLVPTTTSARALLAEARRKGWEGIIAKRTDARYSVGQRSGAWLKLKLQHQQEFVVGGFTEPQRSRPYLGALHVGYYREDGRTLVWAGLCGGGFTHEGLRDMHKRLAALERATSPFSGPVPRTPTPTHWVEPRVVVEIRFNEWTAEGKLRQPIYLGTRDDKPPREVRREGESVERAAT